MSRLLALGTILMFALLIFASLLVAEQQSPEITADDVMTGHELKATGLADATPSQRKAFDEWLTRYTQSIFNLATSQGPKRPSSSTPRASSDCSPTVESNLSGDFNGWEGETIFKLDNGQIWEQAEYSYTYSYSYHPDITIYQVSSGCRMKVEDEDETILVRRIK